MLMVYGTARIAESDIETLREAAEHMVTASRAEDGCHEYAYGFDMFDPTLMRIVEQWEDAEALEAHFATPHMSAWRKALGGMKIYEVELFTLAGEPQELAR